MSRKKDKSPGARNRRLSKAEYLEQLEPLELQLNDVARWLQHTGKRLMVLVEGRDTAGKGGVISAIADTLNPRQCRVVALPKPTDRERTQWYFQRYVNHLPAAGEVVLFDRSWYNRAGVERVMGYCTEDEARAFLKQAPVFEKMLVDDGLLLFKYWLTVDQARVRLTFGCAVFWPNCWPPALRRASSVSARRSTSAAIWLVRVRPSCSLPPRMASLPRLQSAVVPASCRAGPCPFPKCWIRPEASRRVIRWHGTGWPVFWGRSCRAMQRFRAALLIGRWRRRTIGL